MVSGVDGEPMSFGLMAFGRALGAPTPVAEVVHEYTPDVERVLGYGYRSIHRCPDGVGLTDLAIEAGREALVHSGVDPARLDLVVLAITDITEYLFWDAAASAAHRLGAEAAEAVLLTQGCTTGVVCLDVVAGKLATHPEYRNALVIAANRTCEPYWNRMDTQPLLFSDGAVATVARRGHAGLRWLVTEVMTDGRYATFHRLDVGGTAAPFGLSPVDDRAVRVQDAWDIMEFFNYDAERFEAYVTELDERARAIVRRACARAGVDEASLAKVVMLHDNVAAMTALAGTLGVNVGNTNLELSLAHGHFGAADHLFCLSEYVARGELATGDVIALVSRGRGMHWACTLLVA